MMRSFNNNAVTESAEHSRTECGNYSFVPAELRRKARRLRTTRWIAFWQHRSQRMENARYGLNGTTLTLAPVAGRNMSRPLCLREKALMFWCTWCGCRISPAVVAAINTGVAWLKGGNHRAGVGGRPWHARRAAPRSKGRGGDGRIYVPRINRFLATATRRFMIT